MGDVVDFEAFKQRKIERLIQEWQKYLDRAEAFTKQGKKVFADQMVAKAKELRTRIDKLRSKPAQMEEQPMPVPMVAPLRPMAFTFSRDMGHQSLPPPATMKPEPSNE